MKKKFLGALLACSMTVTVLAGCGENSQQTDNNGGSSQTDKKSGDDKSGDLSVSDDGKVLNIYCWNEEFKNRIKDHYPGYEETNATAGKIGDITVKWNITPNDEGAYQKNLDTNLLKQKDAKADDRIDIFLADADYVIKYANSEYTTALADIGINDSDLPDQYQYTKDVVTDPDGKLKGASWQATPGVMFYSREVAKEVFGTDEPSKIQEYVKDWSVFNETAKTLKDAGYSIMPCANDTYRVYSNNVTSKWVVDGKIHIDDNLMKWVEDSKALIDAGYTNTYGMFSDDWKKGFYPEGKVFAYFGPAWLVNFSMAADTEGSIGYEGGWAATEGPQGFYWGGTWIFAASGTDNAGTIKDIIMKLTADESIMKDIVEKDDDFVNNKKVMEEMAASKKYSSKILGGQNPLGIYAKGIENLDLSNVSEYDLACAEEFQLAMKNYYEGNATLDEALDQFYKAVVEKHPELSY